ncbi:MAG: tyrosine-type recombinase/integrase, partial [Anaerolineales bacterium]|nr:tyrosine-type recombinase/integrase [Anaerolineales bacterium]
PGWLVDDIRAYVAHRSRAWLPGEYYQCAGGLLGPLTRFLRWIAARYPLSSLADITPELWFDYLDFRLAAEINPITINSTLGTLQSFLQFLSDMNRPICQRMLSVQRLKVGPHIPKDVPVSQLVRLMQEIETDAASDHRGIRRMGLMDRAWFHLMLHSGLRSCEIRRLFLADIDFEGRRIMIKQSKGLKDRIVFLSSATIEAMQAYLPVRGPMSTDHAFTLRHKPLTVTYFAQRLRTYAGRCGVHVSPHQLRHSCATLLLNAGAPILTVQHLLGHKYIDTTLEYARLYDGTVAADYYRAMGEVEQRLSLGENPTQPTINKGQLIALVDLLGSGTLNGKQRETIRALRDGILTLASMEEKSVDKIVLNC